ncbi:MAG: hypothetical protein M1830_008208 [Pleopsidium flavum]|nr:MAG: hypothetical protein M1830_008208 [Pleopsidium flavum]
MNCSLERLSPELQRLVLLQLPSFQSLHSLIQASPQYYQIFAASKERILSAVIKRIIHPDALPDALAAVRASFFEPRGPNRETALSFIDSLRHDRKIDHSKKLLPLSTSISLCQLHRSIEYLVYDFTQRTSPVLKQYSQSLGLTHHSEASEGEGPPLSSIEEARLQRAFYRVELYGHLFYTDPGARESMRALEQAHTFLAEFPPWQIEELACIRDYISRRLAEAFDQAEDHFVKTVLAEGDDQDHNHDTKSLAPAENDNDDKDNEDDEDNEDDLVGPNRFDLDDDFFSKSTKVSYHDTYMEYMLSLGLPFLHHLFKKNGAELMQSIVVNVRYGGDFLTTALKAPPKRTVTYVMEEIARDNGVKLKFYGDDAKEPNEAWLWSNDFAPSVSWNSLCTQALRHWGYVFWDRSRLRASGIFSLSARDVEDKCGFRKRSRMREPSAEERLERGK